MNPNATPKRARRLRLILATVLLLFAILSLAPPALARPVTFESSIPPGEVVENDAVLTGPEVSLGGEVTGDVLIFGSQIEVSGEVDGSLVVIGRNVKLAGPVAGTAYVVSLQSTLEPASRLARNLYYLGLSLRMEPESQVGRDLVALALGAVLDGTIGRDTRAVIGPLEVIRLLLDTVSGKQALPFGAGLPAAHLARLQLQEGRQGQAQPAGVLYSGFAPRLDASSLIQTRLDTVKLQAWFLGVLRNLAGLLLFALLVVWLTPRPLQRSVDLGLARPWRALGIGLLAMVLAINLVLVALLLFAIVVALGMWLESLGLAGLAWSVWALGISVLVLLVAAGAIFVIYITKVLFASLVGRAILGRLSGRTGGHPFWPVLLGLVLYVLLVTIPWVGWAVAVLATAFGLGMAWLAYREATAGRDQQAAISDQQSAASDQPAAVPEAE